VPEKVSLVAVVSGTYMMVMMMMMVTVIIIPHKRISDLFHLYL